jgi:hypothetical protein
VRFRGVCVDRNDIYVGAGHPSFCSLLFWGGGVFTRHFYLDAMYSIVAHPSTHTYISHKNHTGLTAWALFSWMQPLFATAKRKARQAGGGDPNLDPERDIYPFPFEWRAAEASERLLALRRRFPTDALWASVFRLGG